ncbi:hypothetical protein ALI22I_20370 [Saccharothrix sp. ALI-22-I]|uniref:hypothetical protein n=1 Tax=Saccharothrix sp. ALI-22-I TaxID=1933778 RepID=UPI00097C1FA9|nr:hypothetical protein [Saccharothrix sp. ALI-22-I]ONI88096.1 hypothetical protein ALI22I_20370 [Saccharothrix sp. ALI-22-I]
MPYPYGYPELDELLADAGLSSPVAAAPIRKWPRILIRLAAYWHGYTGRGPARIVVASPVPLPGMPPSHRIESVTMTSTVDFGNVGCASVEALADLLDTDPHRTAYYDGRPAPDVPLHIAFDTEPVDPAVPIRHRPGRDDITLEGAAALMRISTPQHIPARWWPEEMAPGAQAECTSFDYPEMFAPVRNTWQEWIGG